MGLKIMFISIFHMPFIETCHSWQPYSRRDKQTVDNSIHHEFYKSKTII